MQWKNISFAICNTTKITFLSHIRKKKYLCSSSFNWSPIDEKYLPSINYATPWFSLIPCKSNEKNIEKKHRVSTNNPFRSRRSNDPKVCSREERASFYTCTTRNTSARFVIRNECQLYFNQTASPICESAGWSGASNFGRNGSST